MRRLEYPSYSARRRPVRNPPRRYQRNMSLAIKLPQKFNFIGLPAELRLVIYRLIFQDIHITFDGNKDRFKKYFVKHLEVLPEHVDIEIILNYVNASDLHKIALLQASAWCRKDAREVLAANTTIEVTSKDVDACDNEDKPTNILSLVDPTFLKLVPAVHMSPQYFLRTDYTLFSQLKRVRLTAPLATGIERLAFAVHDLGCPRCGDLGAKYYYDHFWTDSEEGKKQLRRLAEENEGWDLDLTLVLGDFKGFADARIELRYFGATRTLMSKCLVRKGEVVLRDGQFSDLSKLAELGVLW